MPLVACAFWLDIHWHATEAALTRAAGRVCDMDQHLPRSGEKELSWFLDTWDEARELTLRLRRAVPGARAGVKEV